MPRICINVDKETLDYVRRWCRLKNALSRAEGTPRRFLPADLAFAAWFSFYQHEAPELIEFEEQEYQRLYGHPFDEAASTAQDDDDQTWRGVQEV